VIPTRLVRLGHQSGSAAKWRLNKKKFLDVERSPGVFGHIPLIHRTELQVVALTSRYVGPVTVRINAE